MWNGHHKEFLSWHLERQSFIRARGLNTWNISFKTLFSGHFTLSFQLIILNYLVILCHQHSTTVSFIGNLPPSFKSSCCWAYVVYMYLAQKISLALKTVVSSVFPNTQSSTHIFLSVFLCHMPWFCQPLIMYLSVYE